MAQKKARLFGGAPTLISYDLSETALCSDLKVKIFPEKASVGMNQPSHQQIATYLTNYALSELVKYVIEATGCTTEQAMERVYNSPLMPAHILAHSVTREMKSTRDAFYTHSNGVTSQ